MASKGNKRSKSNNNSKKNTSVKSNYATTIIPQTNKKPSDGSKDETKEPVEIVPAAQGNPTAKELSQTSSDSDSSAAQGDPTDKESSQTSSDSDRKIEYTSDKTILHLLLKYKKEKKLRYFKYLNDKIPEKWAKKSARLRILLTQMRRVKWWFHFTRNNPNHTKRFYYRFKAIVGLEDWDKINPDIRQAWEDAANRFDVQFGLVRAWTMTPWVLEPKPQDQPNPNSKLKECISYFKAEKEKYDLDKKNWDDMEKLIKKLDSKDENIRKEVEKNKKVAEVEFDIVKDVIEKLNEIQGEWSKMETRQKEDTNK